MRYDDFAVKFGSGRAGRYPVLVLRSPAGEGAGSFELPFDSEDIGSLLEYLGYSVRVPRGAGSPSFPRTKDAAPRTPLPVAEYGLQDVGDLLFRHLFRDEVGSLFDRSMGQISQSADRGLRLQLHFDPEDPDQALLASLPWEFLYRHETREFLSWSRSSPVVRYLDVPRPPRSLRSKPPLRILVAISHPVDLPHLDLDRERRQLERAFALLPQAEITFLSPAGPERLREALVGGAFQILHFMGHGSFDEAAGEGMLLFEGPAGESRPVTGRDLSGILRDAPELRLVVLNSCDSARTNRTLGRDHFTGVATALVLAGLPAVVAMQFPVTDRSAVAFSAAFYRRLALGDPLDAAVVEGRQAVLASEAGTFEWGTPVLFQRAPDEGLFETATAPDASAWSPELPPVPTWRRRIIDDSRYITEKTLGFVGRQWVFDAIDRFTAENPRGYFLLRGDPGIGKTGLLAELVKRRGYLRHFNIRAEGIQQPETFLLNVSAQLIHVYGLPSPGPPPPGSQDSRFLNALLDQAAARLGPGEKVVLLVDALDESDSTSLAPGVNALCLPLSLPAGVFIVASSRRGGPGLRIDCEQQLLDIEQDSADNLRDVRELIQASLRHPAIRVYLAAQGLSGDAFVEAMTTKSEGNFMYLRHVLSEIGRGAYHDLPLTALPQGLASYYEDHWRRMRARDETDWFAYQLPVLAALTAVRQPVSIDLIAEFSGIESRARVSAVLEEWKAFLYTTLVRDEASGPARRRYRLYHSSFHDFIAAKDQVREERLDLRQVHARIVDALFPGLADERAPGS